MGDAFEAIVGAEHVVRPERESFAGARVVARVRPGDAREVAACLRAAAEAQLAVVACGGGSKLHFGNALRAESCALVELGRLAGPIELEADEGVVTLAAGVPLAELERVAAQRGKTTLLAPERPGATLGGALAADAFSAEWSLERRARDAVLGLEVALANGELASCGGRVVKNVTGFDLAKLYCGSLGTLGVITRATLRLRAAPEVERVSCAEFASLEAGLESFARAALECEPTGARLAPSARGVELLCYFAGGAETVAVQVARAPGEAAPLADWLAVRAALLASPPSGRARVRLSARPSDAPAVAAALADLAGAQALRGVFPLAGSVVAELTDAQLPAAVALAAERDLGFFAERASGAGPAPCDAFGPPPQALALMRELKRRFDPRGVLAPGRFAGGI